LKSGFTSDPGDPLAEMHVPTAVLWIFGEPTGRENEEELFFRKWGRDLMTCLIAHLLWTEPQCTEDARHSSDRRGNAGSGYAHDIALDP
jgi:hypothetical protein